MVEQSGNEKPQPENLGAMGRFKENVANIYSIFEDWMRPNKAHPTVVQVLLFIIKLPVLIVVITLSPILFAVMMFVLLVAA